jgi:hypothetical protein
MHINMHFLYVNVKFKIPLTYISPARGERRDCLPVISLSLDGRGLSACPELAEWMRVTIIRVFPSPSMGED